MQITNFRKITCILLACVSVAEAAQKVRWEDLDRFADMGRDRQAEVVMKDGTRLRGLIGLVRPTELVLWGDNAPIATVPRENVARIAFRSKGHYLENLREMLIGSLLFPTAVFVPEWRVFALFTPVVWAYTAVSAPCLLVAEAVSRLGLKPAKVIEIVQ
jgi:hypothetical protein